MIPLDGYRSPTYDDAVDPEGRLRPAARAVMDAVLAHDVGALGREVRGDLQDRGIRFAAVNGDDSWHVDPIPRVIERGDWAALEVGLAQRMRALNAFVGDVYGERRIVSEGILPRRVLETAEHLEPALNGFSPPDGVWIGLAGLDIVRDDQGRWLVLEDNVRTPSGLAYWVAAREATLARLSLPDSACPRPLDELITTALRRTFGPGRVVVLTDGEENSAYWEHRWIAERLELALVEPADLAVRDGQVWHEGERVDGIYRRTNADRLDTELGELLQPVLVAGEVKLVNCFGTGVADDKLAHAYVPDMIRFYLGEEPAIDQVETFDLGESENLERALDSFDELVIKDRGSYGGMGVVVLPHAERADVEALRERVRETPEDFIAQRLIGLSTHPTEIDGRLVPRHVDLRPYVLMPALDEVTALPGGITRVALDEGALVVNSSQNGGAKDTWVQT